MNTPAKIWRAARSAGFASFEYDMVETEPSYMMFLAPALFAGVVYERVVNRFGFLGGLRANIFGCLQA
jgi:hypothetical protein